MRPQLVLVAILRDAAKRPLLRMRWLLLKEEGVS